MFKNGFGLTFTFRLLCNGSSKNPTAPFVAIREYRASLISSSLRLKLPHVIQCQSTSQESYVGCETSQVKKLRELNLTACLQLQNSVTLSYIGPAMHTPGFLRPGITIGHTPDDKVKAILDPSISANIIGDAVPDNITDVIGDNPQSVNQQPAYKARHIQKIRRWHMNRHRLKRVKRKMKMVYRKQRFQKMKQQEERLNVVVNAIKKDAVQFDALKFVKERLERSKKGGFVQDIWKPMDEQPEVPWKEYGAFPARLRTYEAKVKPPPFITKKQMKERRRKERR